MAGETTSWRIFLRRFLRLGLFGFGGPSAHVLIMRQQWVEDGTIAVDEFNDAFASVSLLPGPASTQMALWLGWRLRGYVGLAVAGVVFVAPAVALVIIASHFVLSSSRPLYLLAAALGAGAVVPAIALRAAVDVTRGFFAVRPPRPRFIRIVLYVVAGAVTCLVAAPWLVLVMVASGAVEVAVSNPRQGTLSGAAVLVSHATSAKSALAWMALKIGALSFGGGFVIVPLMRADAVSGHHWMSAAAFLSAVAIGQLTPGPVVATVAAVGYAVGGVPDALLAASIAFAPSVFFIAIGARHLVTLRQHRVARRFLDGAGPAAAGAIAGAALLLARTCTFSWQSPIVVVAVAVVVLARRSATWTLLAGAASALVLEAIFHVAV